MRYCKNCKMFVEPKNNFSVIVFLILLIPFVLFLWLIYFYYTHNKEDICPICSSNTLKHKPFERLQPPVESYDNWKLKIKKFPQQPTIVKSTIVKMVYCSYCGNRIRDITKYCNYCGAKQ